jgi:hypothetical protein
MTWRVLARLARAEVPKVGSGQVGVCGGQVTQQRPHVDGQARLERAGARRRLGGKLPFSQRGCDGNGDKLLSSALAVPFPRGEVGACDSVGILADVDSIGQDAASDRRLRLRLGSVTIGALDT